jgi:hypothetical protein
MVYLNCQPEYDHCNQDFYCPQRSLAKAVQDVMEVGGLSHTFAAINHHLCSSSVFIILSIMIVHISSNSYASLNADHEPRCYRFYFPRAPAWLK